MNQARPNSSRCLIGCALLAAVPIAVLFLVFLVFGFGILSGHIADSKVVTGRKLPARVSKVVKESASLEADEKILYFYSTTITPDGDGNVVTNKRVISYVNDGTDAWCESILIEDIAEVEFLKSDGWLEDSVIVVISNDGTELTLYAATEEKGDERMVKEIRKLAGLAQE